MGENSHKFVLCSGQDSNLWSWNPLDLEADALPIEPPRPPIAQLERKLNARGMPALNMMLNELAVALSQ